MPIEAITVGTIAWSSTIPSKPDIAGELAETLRSWQQAAEISQTGEKIKRIAKRKVARKTKSEKHRHRRIRQGAGPSAAGSPEDRVLRFWRTLYMGSFPEPDLRLETIS